jgi:hypothetical protein
MLGGTAPAPMQRSAFDALAARFPDRKKPMEETGHDGRGRRFDGWKRSRQLGDDAVGAVAMTAAFHAELQSLQGTMLHRARGQHDEPVASVAGCGGPSTG